MKNLLKFILNLILVLAVLVVLFAFYFLLPLWLADRYGPEAVVVLIVATVCIFIAWKLTFKDK